MSIKVNIFYPPLRRFTDYQEVVNANGSTIGECLNHLRISSLALRRGYLTGTVNR